MKKQSILTMILTVVIALSGMTTNVSAHSETKAGNVIEGDYVAVVNTGLTEQKTGSLLFDEDFISGSNETKAQIQSIDVLSESDVNEEQSTLKHNRGAKAVSQTSYSIGQSKSFYQGKTFVCIAVGSESYVWMEQSLYDSYGDENRTKAGQEVVEMYEGKPLKTIQDLIDGQDKAVLFQDGTGKLSILIEELSGSTGYYAGEDGITAIHINAVAPSNYYVGAYGKYDGLIVHEVQHAIFRWFACNGNKSLAHEVSWLNEGLSVAAMDYYWGGDDPTGWLNLINGNLAVRNGSSLMYSDYRNSSVQDYSMPDLFVRYLVAQKEKKYQPLEMLKSFYNNKMTKTGQSVGYVNSVFKDAGLRGENGDLTFEEAIANFYTAAFAQQNEGVYGFYGDSVVRDTLKDYPLYAGNSGDEITLQGTAAIILKTKDGKFTVPSNAGSNIKFIAFQKNNKALVPSKGLGTVADPYQITTAEEFATVSSNSHASYKLMNDIDVSGLIAFPAVEFYGTFDGNNKTITGMSNPLVKTNHGTIKNLTVNGFAGEFKTWTGVLSDFNSGTIMDCVVTGDVNVTFTSTKQFYLPAFGTMSAQNEMSGVITRCYSDAAITLKMPQNTNYAGTIAGINKYQIDNCYAQGSLTIQNAEDATLYAGGIVGQQYSSINPKPTLESCYSTTDIKANGGNLKIGQIAGYLQTESSLTNCYGISGLPAIAEGKTTGADSKTSEELKNQATFVNWKFGSVWKTPVQEYPVFYTPTSVTATLTKTEYYVGESLELYRAVLDTGNGKVELLQDMLEPFDSSIAGEKVIHGNYRGVSFECKVLVKEPVNVTFLEVYTKPTTSYVEGDKFNSANTRLRATINGVSNIYISSGFTIDKKDALNKTDNKVTYTYGNASAELGISVQPLTSKVKSLIVLSTPKNMDSYSNGDTLSLNGVKVQLVYDNGKRSTVFNYQDLEANQIHISKGLNQKITDGVTLTNEDHNQTLYAYYGDSLPASGNNTYAEIGQLSVKRNLYLSDQVMDFTVNVEVYRVFSDEIQGAQGKITANIIQGSLPDGLTFEIGWAYNGYAIMFSGTPTKVTSEPIVVMYELTDKATGKSTQTKVTFRINEQQCGIEEFKVSKGHGSSEYYYGKINDEAGTIEIVIPDTIDKSKLWRVISVKNGTEGLGSGEVDFTNPCVYTAVTKDGKKSKTYTVTVTSSTNSKLPAPTNLAWDKGLASWSKVENATGYIVSLYKENENFIEQHQVTDTAFDFGEAIQRQGNYYFVVTAYGDVTSFRDSDTVKSGKLPYSTPEVRGITMNPTQVEVKAGDTKQFSAELTGIGDYRKDVQWTLSGNQSESTKVINGLLTIAEDESATSIQVRATSLANADIFAEALVNVDALQPLENPTQLQWTGETGSWKQVTNATGYHVSLYRDGVMIGSTEKILGTSIEFASRMLVDGNYTFRVSAYGEGYLDSEVVESAVYQKQTVAKLVSIEVTKKPDVIAYYAGESFDATGLEMKLGYDDGTSHVIKDAKDITAMFTFSPMTILVDTKTITVSYSGLTANIPVTVLEKQTPTARDFDISGLSAVYDKSTKEASISVKDGISDMGNITIKYNGSIEKPILAGSYAVTMDVQASKKYHGVSDMDMGTLIIQPKQLASDQLHVTVPDVKKDSIADNGIVKGITLGLSSKEIAEGDIVNVSVDAQYPSTKLVGTYSGAIVTTTDKVSNQNYELAVGTVLSGNAYAVIDKDIKDITIVKEPDKTAYFAGDSFEKTGLQVMASWEYGEDSDISDQVQIKTDDRLNEDSVVVVEYQYGNQVISKKINITVAPIVLESIEITGSPIKTTYLEGTAFQSDGVKVLATYNDTRKNHDVTTLCSFTPEVLAMNDTAIQVAYTDTGRTKYAVISGIKVKEKSLTSIKIKQGPTKLEYYLDGKIELDGLEFDLQYDNGVAQTITYQAEQAKDFVVTHDEFTMGVNKITVAYQGFVSSFTINVIPRTYTIVDDASFNWTKNKDSNGITMKVDVPLEKFIEVHVDGALISNQNYTVREGSTIVTFKPEYLKTLSVGTHTIEMIFYDGESKATMTIQESVKDDINADKDQPTKDDVNQGAEESNPSTQEKPKEETTKKDTNQNKTGNKNSVQTGDHKNIVIPMLLFMGSMATMIGVFAKKRKSKR